jgi:uncharacterized damage-inducible protein DinB
MATLWFDRRFTFEAPAEHWPEVLARLEGTTERLRRAVAGLSRDQMTRRQGRSWSILEQIGHLLDLDELHIARLEDYERGEPRLRPADLENRKTWEAGHNARAAEDLIADFHRQRRQFIARLRGYPAEFLGRTALHPRLQQPMRVLDMAVFVAEHDDHHLARIEELARLRPE